MPDLCLSLDDFRSRSQFPNQPFDRDRIGPSHGEAAGAPDSTAHKKPVTLGIQNADEVQILSGLTASDMVISTGAYGLDENTKVKIGAATEPDSGKDADDK